MDVVAPPQSDGTPGKPSAPQPPAIRPPEDIKLDENSQDKAAAKASVPKPPKTSNSSSTAIVLALVFFVVLSALAFYAYTSSNK